MNTKATNLILSVGNFITGIAVMAIKAVLYGLQKNIYSDSAEFGTVEIFKILTTILMFVAFIEFVIFNIAIALENKKDKKLMISYFVSAGVGAVTIILMAVFKSTNIFINVTALILVIISIIQFIFIHKQEDWLYKLTSKKGTKILYCITTIMFLVVGTVYIITKNNTIDVNRQYIKDLMKQISKSTATEERVEYIKILKDDKYGFIGEDGKVKIDFIYDDLMDFEYRQVFYKNFEFTYAKKDKEYKILFSDGTEIDLGENPLPWIKKAELEEVSASFEKFMEYEGVEEISEIKENSIPVSDNKITNGNYTIDIKYSEDLYDKEIGYMLYDITIKGKETTELKHVYLPITMEKDDESISGEKLFLYSDGFIPIYMYDDGISGWINKDGEIVKYIKGKYVILDVKNDIVSLLKKDENKIIFADTQMFIYKTAKDVKLYENCYLVRTNDDEIACYDSYFVKVSDTYKYIEGVYKFDYAPLGSGTFGAN